MNVRYNGLSFDFDIGAAALRAQKFTLDITDDTTPVFRNGRPDGYVQGKISASGTITIDRAGLRILRDIAADAGSWQQLPTFDIDSYAAAGDDDDLKIVAYGCKLKVSKVLDVDTSSSDETMFELPYDVTSPDFVDIDGVPYRSKPRD